MSGGRLRIALVNQRYGTEVNGGSEYYTRQLAEHLAGKYDVEVLTTKALDHVTWENYYTKDEERINGVLVRRFDVERKRGSLGMKLWKRVRRCALLREFAEERWIDAQGPRCGQLIRYIREHADDYAAILFVTYLYYPAVRGIPEAAGRAILVPTAHDEPYIYFDLFGHMFRLARGLIYLTPEEKRFVESLFPVSGKPNCVTGAGVDLPGRIDPDAFRRKYGISGDYLIYVGRIEPGKGCAEMFRVFQEYKKSRPDSSLQLVLLGKAMMKIPRRPDIVAPGFVPEEDKFSGIAGSRGLWIPSRYESLSIVVLEAMSIGKQVLVNGACDVLRGHCERSQAGIYYKEEKEAAASIDLLLARSGNPSVSEKARAYIEQNYQWDTIVEKTGRLIELCREAAAENEDE